MKYTLKVDSIYIVFMLLMPVIVVLILTFLAGNTFSLRQSIMFIGKLVLPLYIVLIIFYGTTYLNIAEGGIELYYLGSIKKYIPISNIKSIDVVDQGRGILSLSREKIQLVIEDKEYYLAVNNNYIFVQEVRDMVKK